jgi:hypothetical protein
VGLGGALRLGSVDLSLDPSAHLRFAQARQTAKLHSAKFARFKFIVDAGPLSPVMC